MIWLEKIEHIYKKWHAEPEFPTGLTQLDEVLWGLHKGRLITIASRPREGKTSLAINIAWNLAKLGKKILFITLEMSKEELFVKICARELKISLNNFLFKQINEDSMKQIKEFIEFFKLHPLLLFERGFNIGTIRDIINNNPADVIFIDHLQMIEKGYDERRTIDEYVRGLKQLAIEKHIAIVLLSQINRNTAQRTDNKPQMEDIKGSGGVEEVSDVIMLLYRDWNYRQKDDFTNYNEFEVNITKHRHGHSGKIKLCFEPQYCSFSSINGKEEVKNG